MPPRHSLCSRLAAHARRASPCGLALPRMACERGLPHAHTVAALWMQRVVHKGLGKTRWGLERACEVPIGTTATTPDWRAARGEACVARPSLFFRPPLQAEPSRETPIVFFRDPCAPRRPGVARSSGMLKPGKLPQLLLKPHRYHDDQNERQPGQPHQLAAQLCQRGAFENDASNDAEVVR